MPPLYRRVTVASLLLLGAAAPAYAGFNLNALTNNALTNNALANNALASIAPSPNALGTTGSAVADLNGVAVEGIALPQETRP